MNARYFIILIACLLPTMGCELINSGQSATSGDDPDVADVVVISQTQALRIDGDPVQIQKAELDGSLLTLMVGHAGGCGDHTFELRGWRGWDKTTPPDAHLFLSHNAHGDSCEAFLMQALTFDLEPLITAWKTDSDYRGTVRLLLHEPLSTEPFEGPSIEL